MFNAVNFSDNVEMIVGALDPSARQKSCGPGLGGREPLPKKVNFIPPGQQQQKTGVFGAAAFSIVCRSWLAFQQSLGRLRSDWARLRSCRYRTTFGALV